MGSQLPYCLRFRHWNPRVSLTPSAIDARDVFFRLSSCIFAISHIPRARYVAALLEFSYVTGFTNFVVDFSLLCLFTGVSLLILDEPKYVYFKLPRRRLG